MKWYLDIYPIASISINYVTSVLFTGLFVVLIALFILIWIIGIIGKIVNSQKNKNIEHTKESKIQALKDKDNKDLPTEEIYIAIISAVCSLPFFEDDINKTHKITVTLNDNLHPIWTTSGLLDATKPFYFNSDFKS